jgi:hypothetical protein
MFRSKFVLFAVVVAMPLALPSFAQAEWFWYSGMNILGDETKAKAVSSSGELTLSANGVVTGPCQISNTGSLWNSATMGEGKIIAFTFAATHATPCATNFPGCVAPTITSNATFENPWSITLGEGGAPEEFATVKLTYHYDGCAKYGIPNKVEVEGVATSSYNNANGCFEFANSGDLKLLGSGKAVTLNGKDCLTFIEGEEEVEFPTGGE